ncbi:hypothetical protein [Sphingomonas sp.]|uniref:hypothetical protein n=1 Tax=Sphingomonas sp. TaxID=28214 RepID=UPI002ED91240
MRLALLTIGIVAAAAPAADRRTPAATPAGKPQSCIPRSGIRQTLVRDDRTIDFVTRGKRIYRNVLPQSCPSLGFERRFGYATSLSQLCSTDIITVLTTAPLMRGASCGLGQFQPVTLTR